jgi:hypothetical protein
MKKFVIITPSDQYHIPLHMPSLKAMNKQSPGRTGFDNAMEKVIKNVVEFETGKICEYVLKIRLMTWLSILANNGLTEIKIEASHYN